MTCPSLWLGWRPSWRLSWRLLAAMAVCAVLSACADLKGLRDYAKSSQQLAAGPELVSRWQQSEQVLQSRQVLFDAPVAARRTPQAQALADAQGKKVQEIQRTLAAYFKAVGELAEVTLALPAAQAGLLLPNASIKHRGGTAGVWVNAADGLRFVPVRPGMAGLDGQVRVSGELRAGDRVIVHSEKEIDAGSRIQVVDRLVGGGS